MTDSNETTSPEETNLSEHSKPRFRVYPLWVWGIFASFLAMTCLLYYWCIAVLENFHLGDDEGFRSVILLGLFLGGVCFFIRLCFAKKISAASMRLYIFLLLIPLFGLYVNDLFMVRCSRQLICQHTYEESLGKAILLYTEQHKRFPPPAVCDEAGQPQHSWRMLLPDLEASNKDVDNKQASYNFNLAWDSQENEKAVSSMIGKFNLDGLHHPKNLWGTCYAAVTGEDTVWPDDGTRSLSELSAPSNTAIVVELVDSDIHAAEPRDISLEDLISGKVPWSRLNTHPYVYNALTYPQPGTNVLFADGSVRYYVGTPTPEEIRQLFSVTKKRVVPGMKRQKPSYCLGGREKILAKRPIRAAVYYIWVTCLVTIFAAIFLPRRERS